MLAEADWRQVEDFRLAAADFAASAAGMSWRWVLTQPGGAFLDDHVARLDSADWQYQAFTDPYGWVEHQAGTAGDKMASERRAVAGLGDWIAGRVFGSIAGLLGDKAPCAVRVELPAAARDTAETGVVWLMTPGIERRCTVTVELADRENTSRTNIYSAVKENDRRLTTATKITLRGVIEERINDEARIRGCVIVFGKSSNGLAVQGDLSWVRNTLPDIKLILRENRPVWSTPGTLGISGFPRRCFPLDPRVPESLFPGSLRAWMMPACRGGTGARFHGPRPRGAGQFLLPCGCGPVLG